MTLISNRNRALIWTLAALALTPAQAWPQNAARPAAAQSYTFAFRDAELAQVVEEVLGQALRVSYAIDPGVTARVSFRVDQRLTPAELMEAFETALAASDIVLVREGESMLVTSRAKARTAGGGPGGGRGGYQLVPVPLTSARPSEVAKALQASGGAQVVVSADDATGLLMLGGTAREIEAARQTIAVLERSGGRPVLNRWIVLRNTSATALSGELAGLLAAANIRGVDISPVPRLNGLYLFARSEAQLNEAARWIAQLDVIGGSGDDTLWVYRPKNVAAESLAAALNAVFGSGGGGYDGPPAETTAESRRAGLDPEAIVGVVDRPSREPAPVAPETTTAGPDGTRVAVDRESNSLLISSPPGKRPQLERLLTQIDLPPRQILIEASILEVTLTDEFRLGIDWSFLGEGGRIEVISTAEGSGQVAPTAPGLAITFLSNDIEAAIDALDARTAVEVVSSPKLVALDNRIARLQIGDEVPVATQTSQSVLTPGAPVLINVEYRNTGVILDVTPRITGEDAVTLTVSQEVSSVVRTTTSGIDSPTIRQRQFDSVLVLKNGGTVALGGLISSTDSEGVTGIPLLSQIPGIGQWFRSDSNDQRRTELIVLLKATILPDATAASGVVKQLTDQMQEIRARDLVGP